VRAPLVVLGDALLDREIDGRAERLCPEQPVPVLDASTSRSAPGGAALAAALLARDGRDVALVTALGRDDAGAEVRDLLFEEHVTVVDVGLDGATPEKTRIRSGPSLLCRVDRGTGRPRASIGQSARRLLEQAQAVLVSDYGGGMTSIPAARDALAAARCVVWDPHPRGASPAPLAALVTPNEREARLAAGQGAADALAPRLADLWDAQAVCVTCGDRGAVLARRDGEPTTFPVDAVMGDPCGAGDRFASTIAALLADGVSLEDAVGAACAEAGSFVARGGWHGLLVERQQDADDPIALGERVRARGGVVVATGGCFDLLHAGHVAMLESARKLGDCLVVCLNSDASVRRLKGADRPLVSEDDRAAVLRSLACVDAVVLFDEPTPAEALRRLRPDVFVKGADYEAETLPEAEVMAELGGRVATVPYVAGHSTSRLIEKAVGHAA
jgi:rfaE bifunctional protein nucleotidyltransferase chain/domain/rfaE bifunctional protein kinase chain/domain